MTELDNTQHQTPFKILLLGDSCTDEYHIGTCDRISPEAPVPVVKIVYSYNKQGMSANVYDNLQKLGCNITHITNQQKITKSRFIDQKSGQHLLRVDSEPKIDLWNGQFEFSLDEFNAVVISDYDKGFLSYEQIQQVIIDFHGPVFIDTKKNDLARFSGAFVKINEVEWNNRLSTADTTIVTIGSKGAMYKSSFFEKNYPTKKVEVMDVCGCGDTFLSALVYQYLMTGSWDDAILFANKAASVTVQHRGNYSPSLTEIANA